MKKTSILLPTNTNQTYDYLVPEKTKLELGSFVSVPFRNKEMKGIVWFDSGDKVAIEKLKTVSKVYNQIKLERDYISFLDFFYKYNLTPISKVLRLVLPKDNILENFENNYDDKKKVDLSSETKIKLTKLQKKLAEKLSESVKKNKFERFLIDGVTGSGKTEIYFEAINQALRAGNQSLILLPEIALVNSLFKRVKDRFGFEPAVWHSETKASEKRKIWNDAATGKIKLVIGARSALFLPFKNLNLIVIDEEHDSTYKQQEQVIYNARDMAIARASFENSVIVMASATPSMESIFNVRAKKYNQLSLPKRIGSAGLPSINVIDMREEFIEKDSWISPSLKSEIIENLNNNEQTLLFLNRRGYAPLTICKNCGNKIECKKCDSYLVHHKIKNTLICHQCGFSSKYQKECSKCHSNNSFIQYGPGIERLNEELKKLFPEKTITAISSDNSENIADVMHCMEKGEIDIIIGTQIISKGYHLPNLTLVGIIDADLGLASSDLRASENTFQLLQQVAGRSGREEKPGRAFLQTYYPDHPVILSLINYEKENFINIELSARERSELPPYGRLASITLSDVNEEKLIKFCKKLSSSAPASKKVNVLGPAPAPITKIRNRYRYKFLVKANKNVNIQEYIRQWLFDKKKPSSIRILIDIDPYNFL